MPLNREDLAAAVRANDDEMDRGGDVPYLLTDLGVDPQSSVYVAEQRALRVAMLHSGVSPAALRSAAQRGIAFTPRLDPQQRYLIPVYASVWLDGLAAGVRAYQDALSA